MLSNVVELPPDEAELMSSICWSPAGVSLLLKPSRCLHTTAAVTSQTPAAMGKLRPAWFCVPHGNNMVENLFHLLSFIYACDRQSPDVQFIHVHTMHIYCRNHWGNLSITDTRNVNQPDQCRKENQNVVLSEKWVICIPRKPFPLSSFSSKVSLGVGERLAKIRGLQNRLSVKLGTWKSIWICVLVD